ncbi:SusC/RagA family TonB-linked outer membrane protein [uncultured Mucilaginibacter sp.]|uniref:SusC/RagA family TonB-linked outer membrane protein n=1 Tax=uncultured Mucilaginibacter sp. TaxID=797541 RepID=UPI00261A1D0B|nr:SusC/RagA family TonB-linked outer membrane protein [uncultured Mucilaginibacter sp.]
MKQKLLIFFLLGLFALNNAFAQNRKITGVVTGADDGQPLPGVSVMVQGTKVGTLTDGDGKFTLNVPTNSGTLVFTFIGYATQNLTITGSNTYNVKLATSTRQLSEVVVQDSYGTQSKKSYTGSAETVSGARNENKPFSTFQQALQGEVAGVAVTSSSGQPGANNQVRIRGLGSITNQAAAQPLYVIDGMIVNAGDLSQRTNGANSSSGSSNALAGINENDIETITVLKDASATAIYGSRGSNGVIVITTKRGRNGKTQIRFDAELGKSNNVPLPVAGKLLTPDQFKTFFDEGFRNYYSSQINPATKVVYTPAEITANIASLDNTYALTGPGNDWVKLVTKNGSQQQYNVSLNGGDEKTKIFSSVGYFKQDATIIKSYLERVTGLINLDHTISKSFSITTGINASNVLQNTPLQGSAYYSSPWASAYFLRPFQMAYNPDGTINSSVTGNANFPTSGNSNPLYIAAHDSRSLYQTRILGNQTIRWNIVDQLKYTGYASADYQNLEETTFLNPIMGDARSLNGSGTSAYSRYFNWLIRNQLDYRYDIPGIENFFIDATVGYEAQRSAGYLNQAYATGYPATQPTLTAVGVASTPATAYQATSNYTFDAVYSRVGINFKNRYSLSASLRNDGSSRFGTAKQFGTFYSIGGAWNIDQETFFGTQKVFTTAKIRSSYGTTGNANSLTNYQWRPTAGYTTSTGATVAYNSSSGQAYNTIGNVNLTWESQKKFDLGTDFGFFNDRLTFSVDYYKNLISGLISNAAVAWELGFTQQAQNIGAMRNQGVEFAVKGIPVKTRDFTWNVNFNLAHNANTMTMLANLDAANPLQTSLWLARGYDYYTWYSRQYAGVNPSNGNALWYTDGTKTATTTNYSAAQRVPMGQADPKIISGFNNSFTFKGITLSVDFYGSFGNRISDSWSYYLNDGTYLTGSNKYVYTFNNRWTTPGQITDVPKDVYAGGSSSSSSSFSSRFLYYGDFIRLKNASLGYDFKNISYLNKIGISRLYLYGRATNLYTKTYDKRLPFDPEVPVNGFSTLDLPQVRTFTIGLNVGL